ncbi:Uncharacterized protein FWK35_00000772 [Aphis craccivora]|uniref:Uncharacterized protein n=1 Tax=Aphis craccivora TaxID=307492 RepID=A0A6G0ZM42_APHCR|nr:Uncharacterized protein FWK35_00000772 [Aphis craccivora]
MMNNQFNFVISAVIAIVFVVSLADAKYVLQTPVVDNQSSSFKPSAQPLSDTSFPISHVEAEEKSTTNTIAHTTLAMSPTNTTTVTAVKITNELSTSNNINATTFIEETSKPTTTAYRASYIEETIKVQATTISNVETVISNQTPTNQTTESGLLITRFLIRLKLFTKCPSGETENANGGCSPISNVD